MSKHQIALILAGLLASAVAQADSLAGIYAGAHYWDTSSDAYLSGDNGLGDTTRADFDFGKGGKGSFWLAIEHPLPLLPNLMARYNQLGGEDVTTLAGDIEIDDKLYQGGTDLVLDARLDHVDLVLYYELLDNDLASLDLGLNLKLGDFELSGTGIATGEDSDGNTVYESLRYSVSYNGVVPLAYAAAKVAIPGSGLSLFGDISGLAYQDHKLYDGQLGVGYDLLDNPVMILTAQLGYRVFRLQSDDIDALQGELRFDGGFAGLVAHF